MLFVFANKYIASTNFISTSFSLSVVTLCIPQLEFKKIDAGEKFILKITKMDYELNKIGITYNFLTIST
jgi:hypothetical protein